MSRPATHPAPIVRAKTLDKIQANPFEDAVQSEKDLPKVVAAGDVHDISSPIYSKYSKVLLSEQSRVFKPPLISERAKVGTFPSPLSTNPSQFNLGLSFVSNAETILYDIISDSSHTTISREFLRAGPRQILAFNPPSQVKACIVTCGGLCPGLNAVIREIVMTLSKLYGVKHIWGVPFGYRGFYSTDLEMIRLTEQSVEYIHHEGGSVLGSSRGGHDTKMICDAIESYGFNQVYIIGGDGTHRGASKIFEELKCRKAKVSVVGVPKTIDNDIALIDKSFGFDTAVGEAQRAINCAQVEARSAVNGIGLVKLMGRHSGQIAMFSSLASREVDCCLIPEVKFVLEGPRGLFQYIEDKLRKKKHMVIVVAEGAAPDLLAEEIKASGMDASGNVKCPDVGLWLQHKIEAHFKALNFEINLKLIDPTYEIRSVPANASDNLICGLLAQSAVHGAMHGFSGFSVGLINTHFVLIPIDELCARGRTKVDVRSRMWHRVIASTQQPCLDGSGSTASVPAAKPAAKPAAELNGAARIGAEPSKK